MTTTTVPTWELISTQVPLRRDGDPEGLVLCQQGTRWFVAKWNSADARNADSWCHLPSWVPRQPLPPLLEYLRTQGISDLDGAKPELIAATAIEAIFAWLQEEATDSRAYEDAYEAWVDLCFPALADAATDMADPEPPSQNGHSSNGHVPQSSNGHHPPAGEEQPAESEPEPEPEPEPKPEPDPEPAAAEEQPVVERKSGAPGAANDNRIYRTPIPTSTGRIVHFATKINEQDAKAVIAGTMLGVSQHTIAKLVGTSRANVSQIASGRTWSHVRVTTEELAEYVETLYSGLNINKDSYLRGTIKQAREIRRLYHHKNMAPDAIARTLDVSIGFVQDVIARRVFRHIRYTA